MSSEGRRIALGQQQFGRAVPSEAFRELRRSALPHRPVGIR